jgi:hypothetical protein
MKLPLKTRLKLARLALRGQPFEIVVEGYHPISHLRPESVCDNNFRTPTNVWFKGCSNESVVCISRTVAELTLRDNDHYHLCQRCADDLVAQNKKKEV